MTLVRESGTPDEERRPLHRGPAARARRAGDAAHAGAVHQPPGARRADDRRSAARLRGSRARAAAGDGRAPPATSRSRARSATCRRSTPAARRRCSTRPTPRAAAAGADPVRGTHRAHRRVLDARPGAGVRAARRHRADLHPSRQEHSRRHLHLDLGRADGRIDGTQAGDAGRLHQPSGRRSADRRGRSAARCARRCGRGCARAGCAACCRWPRFAGRTIPTSSCWCTATTTPGTKASATTRPATPRCSSWRACCGGCAIDSSAACASPGGRAIRPAAMRDRRGMPTPSPTRSTSTASRSSTSTRPAAPTPRSTKK